MFPIWECSDTVAILVSTPPKNSSPFTELLYKRHPKTGEKLVMDYILDLVCTRCKANKKTADNCRHKIRAYLPDHKSAEKLDIVHIIHPDKETFNRESLMFSSDIQSLFFFTFAWASAFIPIALLTLCISEILDNYNKKKKMLNIDDVSGLDIKDSDAIIEGYYVDAFIAREPWTINKMKQNVKCIMVTCDPNTKESKKGSDMSLIATALVDGHYVILGFESYPTNTSDEACTLLDGFIKALRSYKAFANSWIVFCCERNMAHEAGFLSEVVKKYAKVECIAQHGDDDYGWWTTKPEKTQYAYCARTVFSTGNIVYMKDPICVNTYIRGDARAITQKMFEEQLKFYSPVLKEGKNDLAFNITLNLKMWERFLHKSIPGLDYELLYR